MNNITIDIGNTTIKYGIFDENNVMLCHGRIENHADIHEIQDVANKYKPEYGIIAITGDVSDDTIKKLKETATNAILFTPETPIPIENLYKTPMTLGADRLAAAIAAYNQTHNATLIIDIGTAITIDIVNSEGQYLGGNISPGIQLRFMSLNEHTAKLPLISQEGICPEYGVDTETAIRCGVLDGIRNEIQGYISKFSLKFPNLSVFLTGGDQIYFDEEIKKRTFADKYLVLKGLNQILTFNKQNIIKIK